MKQVIIRKVIPSDVTILIKLIEQLGYSITLSELQANIELCLSDKHYSIFVAETQGEICGFIGVVIARWLHCNGAWAIKFQLWLLMMSSVEQKSAASYLILQKIMLKPKVVIK